MKRLSACSRRNGRWPNWGSGQTPTLNGWSLAYQQKSLYWSEFRFLAHATHFSRPNGEGYQVYNHMNSPGPFPVHPVHCRLLPQITPVPSTKVLWRLCYRRPHQGQGPVWTEPPPVQRQEDQRAGGGFQQAQTTLHTGEHPGYGHWNGDMLQVPGSSHESHGLITLQLHISKVRADCICWGSSWHSWQRSSTGGFSHFLWSSLLQQQRLGSR